MIVHKYTHTLQMATMSLLHSR